MHAKEISVHKEFIFTSEQRYRCTHILRSDFKRMHHINCNQADKTLILNSLLVGTQLFVIRRQLATKQYQMSLCF